MYNYIIATALYQVVYQVFVTKTMELIRLLVLWGGSGTQKTSLMYFLAISGNLEQL